MFQAMMSKVGPDLAATEQKPEVREEIKEEIKEQAKEDVEVSPPIVPSKKYKPIEISPVSDEQINIDEKAIKKESKPSTLDDMAEYEKKLMRKFKQ
jgi:hypothetical protein